MAENTLNTNDTAQNGKALSPTPAQLDVENPLLDRLSLENQFGDYKALGVPEDLPAYSSPDNVYRAPNILSGNRQGEGDSLKDFENFLLAKTESKPGGSIVRTLAEVSSNRYDNFVPGNYNNEDAYGQNQSWGSKMVNGVGKGLLLTGTTFLQGTVGLVNGLAQWGSDGRFASFYDNEFNRSLDEIIKKAEDVAPNFYTDVEKNAKWYSPDYFMTGNFLWDGVVKNMGFAAGAYLTGGVYSAALKGLAALPGASRLLSMGRAAEAVAASEEALIGLDKGTEAYGKIKQLSDAYLTKYNVLSKGHRAVVAGLSTSGEAGFEAYQNLNDFRNTKIQEFKDANGGLEPKGEDLAKINSMADGVGNASFAANVALLSATNYIQFPKILGSSYTAEKGIMNNLTKEIGDITTDAAGKYVVKESKNKVLNTLNKVRPYLFSTSEGFEEGAQFSIGVGVKDYYDKKYNNEPTSWISAFSTGIQEGFLSDEGAKNVLIGGLSGALMMGRSNYSEAKAQSADTKTAIEKFNQFQLSDFTKETIDSVNRGTKLQEERESLLKKGNISDSKDKETDYIINYLTPRIKFGRYDLVKADIDDQRALASSDNGFNQLVKEGKVEATDTKEAFLARLNSFEQTANNVKSLYQSLNLRYGGVVNAEGKPLYTPAVMDKMIYAATKVSDYEQRIPSLTNKLSSNVNNISEILQNVSEGNLELFDIAKATLEASTLLNKEDLVEALDDAAYMTVKRDVLLKEYDSLKKTPENHLSVEKPVTDVNGNVIDASGNIVPKETITVKTKKGNREIEIGTEYFLGKVVGKSAKGNEVYRAPRLFILAKNEDGTIKVQDSDGKVHDIKESTLEKYNLGKVESTLKNKKAKFYMEHWDTVYEFNFGAKTGGKQKGRIEYDPENDVMLFVYKNKKGELKEIEVTGDQFKLTEANKKKGFTEPMIRAIGELTQVQKQSLEEYTAQKDLRLESKREARLKILNELFEELSNSQDKSQKLVEQKQKVLENINKELAELQKQIEENAQVDKRFKKSIQFNSVTKKALENAMRLSRMQEQLENEIQALESDIEEIEFNLNYVSDLYDNIDSTATNFYDFKNQLEDEIIDLEVLREQTAKQITVVSKLLNQSQKALDYILDMLSDFIKKFENKYPNVPRLMGQDWVDFLQDNPNFLKLKPNYKNELQDLNELIALHEDGEIIPSEKRIADLKDHLDIMQEEFKNLSKEIEAKYTILNKFAEVAEQYKKQDEEAKQMQRNVTLGQELIGTLTASVQNFFGTKPYEQEAKKDKLDVVGSTKPFTEDTKDRPLPGYAARVNHFGARVSDMDNADDLRGVIVTADTEDQILSGLTEAFLSEDIPGNTPEDIVEKNRIRAEVIFLVITENGQLVDKDGKLIPGKSADETQEAYNKRLYNNAIFQVFPSAGLVSKVTQKDGSKKIISMFRDSVPQYERDSLKAQYKEWRDTQLANKTLDKKGQKFKTSFGNLEFVKYKNADGTVSTDTSARTSAQEAGLLAKGILNRDAVITVATTNDDKSEGKVSFKSPKGRVFLRIPGQGLVRLFNKKFNKTESEVIFDAILNLAKNASANGSLYNNEKEEVNKNILSWLKSVVYWGIAKYPDGTRKPAGYNNIWFEDVLEDGKQVKKLFMSGLQKESQAYFDFTPQGLLNRKQDILGLLGQMYANTDAKRVNIDSYNAPYDEILRFDSLGNPVTRTWPNYQTYLLSANIVDSQGNVVGKRTGKEIPLTTQVRPLKSPEDTNRKGVYFTLNSSVEYTVPAAPVAKPVIVTPAPVVVTPAAQAPIAAPVVTPTVTPQQQPTPPGQYNLNGTAENTRMFGNGVGEIRFTFNSAKVIDYIKSFSEDIFAIQGLLPANISEAFFKNDIISLNEDDVRFKIGQIKENLRDSNPTLNEDQLTGKALNIAVSMIWKDIAPQIVSEMIPVQPAIADEAPVVEETPIVETPVKLPVVKGERKIVSSEIAGQGTAYEVEAITPEGRQILISYDGARGSFRVSTEYNAESGTYKPGGIRSQAEDEKIALLYLGQELVDQLKTWTTEGNKGTPEGFIERGKIADKLETMQPQPEAFELENKEAVETPEEIVSTTELPEGFINLDDIDDVEVDRSEMRVAQLIDKLDQFKPEQWSKVEEAMARMLPNIPFYRVKNMIKGTNGRQAWGMLHNAAIYVYESAEEGTAYHEVFEAVWKMFAGPTQKQAIISEFKKRKGTFVDRESGKTIDYKNASAYQIKEQLAEEFRDAVLNDKLSLPKESKTLIGRLFSQLIDFIKAFFTGENAQRNTKELFNNIGNGYYAQFNPYESQLSFAKKGIIGIENAQANADSEMRSTTIPEIEMHDIIQHMTFLTLTRLSLNNKSVFTVSDQKESELYPELKLNILKLLAKQNKLTAKLVAEGKTTQEKATRLINNNKSLSINIQNEWAEIIKNHKAHLKTFDVQFDENDEGLLNNEENTGRGEFDESNKVDSFRKANAALKLVLSTIPVTEMVNGNILWKPSSIGGVTLIPVDQIHIDLKAKLHNSMDIEDMLLGLKTMAENNPNYNAIFRRLTGNSADVGLTIDTIEEHDFQLASALWKSISMQNPDVITVFLQEDGDVVVSNSTLSTAAKQAKKEMIRDIISTIKADQSIYFRYVPSTGKYYAKDNLKALQFDGSELKQYINFLKTIGINFTERDLIDLKPDQLKAFKESVNHIKNELSKVGDKKIVKDVNNNDVEEDGGIRTINTTTLNIDGDLLRLAIVKAVIENTEFQSTYFNINGERTQSFIGTNLISALHNTLSKLRNIEELQNDARYKRFAYLSANNDVFAQGSQVLKKMFDIVGQDSTGKRRAGTEDLLKPVIVDGIVDEQTGKKKEASKVSYKQRLMQELNLNLSGIFMNLVPGDASLEHAIKMYNEKDPFVSVDELSNKNYLDIFKDYFIAEVELIKENRNTAKNNGRDFRFFKAILGEDIHKKLASKITSKTSAEQLYEDNKQVINSSVESFIAKETKETEELLRVYDIITTTEDNGVKIDKVAFFKKEEMVTQAGLNTKLKALSINYIIANIEMHKLLYSDPYQYKDELKRIKNFNSPGQALVPSSQAIDSRLNTLYNKGFEPGDIGHTDMTQDHFRSVTIADVLSTNENLGYDSPYEETDGGGLITDKANRVFKLRAGTWTSDNERQFRYDVAFEKTIKGLALSQEEKELFKKGNPGIKDTYTPVKPIVRGNKENGRTYNDIVLHKFALVPLSFRVLYELNPNSNAIKLYNKMQKENIDYAVFASGSKVGTEKISPLYKANGEFDTTPFQDAKELKGNLKDGVKRAVSKIPFTIVAVQSEVPSKDTPSVTQGSQITKLATMDYLESGVPVDFMPGKEFEERFLAWLDLADKSSYNNGNNIYNEIVNNQKLLEARIEDAVETLYKKLGIKETIAENGEKQWKIEDRDKLVKTLTEEIGKREINYNITDAFEGFVKGDTILEATPVYQQVRNILYSIADKTIVRPKISGGMKVQVSSALLESVRAEGKPILDKKGNQVLNEDGSPKLIYASNELAFYKNKDGERVCEIMIGRWFKSNKTDAELMDYFNNDPEGKKEFAALMGVAFRIPTQKQNSIDVFRIKQFLPKDFGDSVIIPSALVKKAGSDFDIDKLSIYLKSLYQDAKDKLRVIPFYGIGEQAKYKFEDLFYDTLDVKIDRKNAQILSQESLQTIFGEIAYGESTDKIRNKWIPIFREMFEDTLVNDKLSIDEVENAFITKIEKLGKSLNKLTNVDLQTILAQDFVDSMYKKSLENAYIQSLENLISHPLNYDNLVKPNDADPLKKLSEDIQREMGYEKADFGNVGNMLSRGFMSNLRQSFVGGKQALGIAAQGQVGHAQRQRSVTYIDVDRLEGDLVDEQDKIILGHKSNSNIFATDTDINFQEYNSAVINGVKRPMLSWIKNKAGEYISDINGMFIDGYVDIAKGDWIIKLGATTNTSSTWLFLIDLGVPIKTVGYFMNQPIIRDYLRTLENKGYSWLYIEDIITEKLEDYSPSKEFIKSGASIKGIPSETDLLNMLKYNNAVPKSEMSDLQNLQQQYMLKEFLKYAKMSSHMFNVSQASNYDTANINDPYLVFKKMVQLEKARKTIISSVDDIMAGSFVKELKDKIFDYRDAFSEILMSDKGNVRQVMQKVLMPYTDMSDRDFVKLSQKAVNDLFDWAVQTTYKEGVPVNTKVARILLGTETEKSAAEQIIDYRDSILGNPVKGIAPNPNHKLFNNIILNSLSIDQNDKKGGKKGQPINLIINNRDNKVADQNLTIFGFNELRETLREENNLKLYGKLTRLALLQSGLTSSPISFTNLLPYEDFKGLYNETLSILEKLPNLAQFQELNVFERNNWNNSDVAAYKRETIIMLPKKDGTGTFMFKPDTKLVDSLVKAVDNKVVPRLVGLSPMSEAGRKDFIVYTYEDRISSEQRILRRKTGNTDHQHKVLMQKVYTENAKGERTPLLHITEDKGNIYTKFVFKAVNAWGDSFRAQEFYTTNQQSVLDNGFDKVDEVEDDVIVDIYRGGATITSPITETVIERTTIIMQPQNVEKILNGTKTTTIRESIPKGGNIAVGETKIVNFGDRDFNVTNRGQLTIDEAGGVKSMLKSEGLSSVNDFMYQQSKNWVNGQGKMYVFDITPIKSISEKPEGITQEEWDSLSQEEKNKINEC